MQIRDPSVAAIDATWFGAGLSPQAREQLLTMAREYEAPAGTVLLREGLETRELSVVAHGQVALSMDIPGRGPLGLTTVEPGDIFGWSALVPPFLATSTARAVQSVVVIAFDASHLRAAVRADPVLSAAIHQQVLEAVARRLIATRDLLVDVWRLDTFEPL